MVESLPVRVTGTLAARGLAQAAGKSVPLIQGFAYGPLAWALASSMCSKLWAAVLNAVYDGVIVVLSGFRSRGPY